MGGQFAYKSNQFSPQLMFFHCEPSTMKAFSEKFIFTKKLPLYPCLSSLKTKFSVKFITEAQSCPPSLAFSTETFETEKFIMRRRGRFLLFLFSLFLSANLVCSWLCQSWLDSDKVYMFFEIKNENVDSKYLSFLFLRPYFRRKKGHRHCRHKPLDGIIEQPSDPNICWRKLPSKISRFTALLLGVFRPPKGKDIVYQTQYVIWSH